MKLSKSAWVWIAIVSVILLITGIAIYIFRCDIFNGLSSCVEDPNKSNTPVPPGSSSPTWKAETFPLNVGMYGPKIKALQTTLGISADGKFGQQTKSAITSKGYSVPLSQSDYNTLINSGGGSASQNIKGVYAKFDGVKIYSLANKNNYRTANKNAYIGQNTGDYEKDTSYWVIDGIEIVNKNNVSLKG